VPDVPLWVVLFAFAVFLLAGFVKGSSAWGCDDRDGPAHHDDGARQAAALLVIPNAATNAWQALAGKHLRPLLRRFWPMLLGICVGSAPGAGFLASDTSAARPRRLASCFASTHCFRCSRCRCACRGGGVVACSAHRRSHRIAFGPHRSLCDSARALPQRAVASPRRVDPGARPVALDIGRGACGGVGAGGRVADFPPRRLGFALAPAGVGVLFGQWLRKRTHPAVFVRVFAVGLLLIGLHLALRNLT